MHLLEMLKEKIYNTYTTVTGRILFIGIFAGCSRFKRTKIWNEARNDEHEL